ncbi:MAG: hypothetical protein R3325_15260, partial [Thermoanaerobaculia bacterium]|nr:hypothetical protein [Thermoanaerobaculia bacterium]
MRGPVAELPAGPPPVTRHAGPVARARRLSSRLAARGAAGALALALLGAAAAHGRTLHWRALAVEARLDGDGKLLIVERQTMVFDGAWNGGQRDFLLEPGERLELYGVQRVDPASGVVVRLTRGDLDRVDHYDWIDRDTLRWRSRLPGDPPFENQAILYELYYSMTGVVEATGEGYRLLHPFAFSDRVGTIERFELDLAVDPEWRVASAGGLDVEASETGSRISATADDLRPGLAFWADITLERTVAAAPASVRRKPPRWARLAMAAAIFSAGLLFWRRLRAHERAQGRYDPPVAAGVIDRGWLEERVLGLRAEEAGALWDQAIGSAEVSAILARWVAEGRVRSSVREGRRRPVMELELAAPRAAFDGYERALLDKLFFDGRTRTDTEAVKERYKSSGFSPVATITPGLHRRLREVPGFGEKLPAPRARPTFLLFLGAAALLGLEAWLRGPGTAGPALATLTLLLGPLAIPAYLLGYFYRRRADLLGALHWAQVGFAAAAAGSVAAVVYAAPDWGIEGISDVGVAGLLGMTLATTCFLRSVFNTARTRDGRAAVARRRELAGARRHLAAELQKPEPELEDSWVPYLLAFGLQRGMDRWAQAFGGAGSRVSTPSTAFSGSSRGSSGGWTGGGGAFGGAGATS